ncbi:hypothetical protein SAMN05421788_103111 [Filimonas lacunae]|uniref:Uncharacterized protein n=1 Tax=Filimonas lacunae TaxID=477680 RepID=A0A173MK29_9BACT|nr:hypothetical protein [Filimonas lacunae]BAV07761.1 hypothetical protein FLA_3792 [Filimonas lacunae]SIT04461.1 hypothetical protein SAMN05421788_103111 [Filimonas lacunae]
MRLVFIVLFSIWGAIVWSCSPYQPEAVRCCTVNADYIPKDSVTLYFPAKVFVSDTGAWAVRAAEYQNAWYSTVLFTLHEPVLFAYPDSIEVFRFTWLRSFHPLVSIRLMKNKVCVTLAYKVFSGPVEDPSARLLTDTCFTLDHKEWNQFTQLVDAMGGRSLKVAVKDDSGKDGAEWILEGKTNGQYYVVSRWSPESAKDQDFKNCCLKLIALAGIQLKEEEVY